jgi:hypothetical protein
MELLLPNGENIDDRSWGDERKVAASVEQMMVVDGSFKNQKPDRRNST